MAMSNQIPNGYSPQSRLIVRRQDFPFYILFLVAFFSPWLYLPAGENSVSYVDIISPLIIAALIYSFRIALTPPYIFYISFIFITALSTLDIHREANVVNAILAIRLLFISAAFVLACKVRRTDFNQVKTNRTVSALWWGLGLATTIGISLHLLGIQINDSSQRLWLGKGLGSTSRAGGLVGNSGDFGQTAALFFIVSFAGFVLRRLNILTFVLCATISSFAVYISSSRAALVMIFLFVAIYLLATARRNLRVIVSAFLLLVISSSMIANIDINNLSPAAQANIGRLDVFNLTGSSNFLSTERFSTWQELGSTFFEIPVLGHGYKTSYGIFQRFIDNSFLLIWFEGGVFSFTFFVLFWTSLFYRCLKAHLSRRDHFSAIAISCFVVFLFRNLTGGAISNWSTAPAFFLMLGLFSTYPTQTRVRSST